MTKNKQTYWYLAASALLIIFAFIAFFVATNSPMLANIDNPIIQLIRGNLTDGKTTFFSFITTFGNTSTVIILTAILAVIFYLFKEKNAAIWLVANIVLIQGLGNTALKLIFNRSRPTVEHLVSASGNSFPSGHSMGSMLLYGTLIFLAPRYIKNNTICLFVQLILSLIILLVGTSRIYLGVHFPTDIIGGFSVGLCWLCFSYPYIKQTLERE